jgi:PAS domain S-box-containing protein
LQEESRCWKCSGTPIIGCILATDTDREQPLSKVDLIMLETLGQNLATVLENAQLYEDLRREERFRENVIGGLSNGLLSVGLDGDITLCNSEALRLSGYGESELLGRAGSDLLSDARGRDPLTEALAGERSPGSLEASLRTADGRTVPIQLTTSLLRDDRGEVYGAIGEFVDLSAIKSMKAKIRHLDKLAAMGRFTSSIAHEIRNPLAGITAGIQYMAKDMQGDEATHVQFILAEVDRLNRIINDLFSVGRPLELSPRQTDVVDLVERSLRTLETRFRERQVQCAHHTAPDLPAIDLDADRIEQVLINFIQNAIDASPAGSTVTIEERLGSSLDPGGDSADVDSLIIDVRDQGSGISDEEKEKIFEPFYTTKSSGTGLGLYVCHHIVEGHGGQIVVESRQGEGSRFLLCLPMGRSLREGSSETADFARG